MEFVHYQVLIYFTPSHSVGGLQEEIKMQGHTRNNGKQGLVEPLESCPASKRRRKTDKTGASAGRAVRGVMQKEKNLEVSSRHREHAEISTPIYGHGEDDSDDDSTEGLLSYLESNNRTYDNSTKQGKIAMFETATVQESTHRREMTSSKTTPFTGSTQVSANDDSDKNTLETIVAVKVQEMIQKMGLPRLPNEIVLKNNPNQLNTTSSSIKTGGTMTVEGPQSVTAMKNEERVTMNGLRNFIRDTIYTDMKYCTNDAVAKKIIHVAMKKTWVQLPFGHTKLTLIDKYTGKVYSCFTQLRHNGESAAREKYLCECQQLINPEQYLVPNITHTMF